MKAMIIQHQRGNHSDYQVLNYGKCIFRGTITEVKREMVSMRQFLRSRWRQESTNSTMADYVEYNMGDVWAFKNVNGEWLRM